MDKKVRAAFGMLSFLPTKTFKLALYAIRLIHALLTPKLDMIFVNRNNFFQSNSFICGF